MAFLGLHVAVLCRHVILHLLDTVHPRTLTFSACAVLSRCPTATSACLAYTV